MIGITFKTRLYMGRGFHSSLGSFVLGEANFHDMMKSLGDARGVRDQGLPQPCVWARKKIPTRLQVLTVGLLPGELQIPKGLWAGGLVSQNTIRGYLLNMLRNTSFRGGGKRLFRICTGTSAVRFHSVVGRLGSWEVRIYDPRVG